MGTWLSRRLRKRTRILRGVLALTLVVALAAVAGFVLMIKERNQANTERHVADELRRRAYEALGERLTSEGQAILAGGQPGSELGAVVKIIAAQHILS